MRCPLVRELKEHEAIRRGSHVQGFEAVPASVVPVGAKALQ